jgi:glycosyltransferase involved in cell wall biosynthesis
MAMEQATGRPGISIVIPAYNDSGSIEEVAREASFVARRVSPHYEILVADDGSRDSTGEILDKLSREMEGLRVIHHGTNRGFGFTIRELYQTARGELVLSIPGDGQIRASQLERMLPAAALADIVVGWREIRNDARRRKFQSYVYNFLIRFLYRVTIGDVNSVKLIHRRALEGMALETQSPFVDAELCIRALRRGMTIRGVVVEHMPRQFGEGGGGKGRIILETVVDMLRMWPKLRPRGEGPFAAVRVEPPAEEADSSGARPGRGGTE